MGFENLGLVFVQVVETFPPEALSLLFGQSENKMLQVKIEFKLKFFDLG